LVAALVHTQAVDPIDRLVLRNDQPADVTLKFNESLSSENIFKEGRIVLNQFRKFHQWKHAAPPENRSPRIVQRSPLLGSFIRQSTVKIGSFRKAGTAKHNTCWTPNQCL
jgi:hypothetical protein